MDNYNAGMQNRMGVLFFVCIYFSLTSMSSLGVFINQRKLFWREIAAGYYNTLAYYMSQYWCDILPLRIIPPVMFSLIIYQMTGLQDDPVKFIIFMMLMILTNVVAGSFCLAISALSVNVGQANFISVIFLIAFMLFGGLLLSNDTGGGLSQFKYLSFMNYAFESLAVNEFTGLELIFNAKGQAEITLDGTVILDNLGLKPERFSGNVQALLLFWFVFASVGFLSVRFFHRSPK